MKYKVFRQLADNSFLEIGNLRFLEDAEAVMTNYNSGMITDRGAIIQTKNLKSEDTPTLPISI